MTVDLQETRLPGVGVKYAFRLAHGGRLAVILHNDGEREVYFYRRAGDDEPTAVIELHDDEARQLGAVLGGAYERRRSSRTWSWRSASSASNGSRAGRQPGDRQVAR